MKIKTLPVLVLTLLISSICASAALGQTNATVAAWNLGGFEPIPPARVERLARVIHNLRPHVIALTEVNPAEEVLQKLVDDLGEMGDNYCFLYFPENAFQNIALLYRCNVQVTDDELIAGSDDNNPTLRKALAAKIKIRNFDFYIIAVHLKSARGTAERATRTRQATAIANYISLKTSGNEKDVLVVGDYNMIPIDDEVNFSALSPGPSNSEFLRFVSTEKLSGQASHISRCDPLGGNLLDGYAISRAHTGEYRSNSLRMPTLTDPIFAQPAGAPMNCVNYKGFISDHFPLVAQFKVNGVDDD